MNKKDTPDFAALLKNSSLSTSDLECVLTDISTRTLILDGRSEKDIENWIKEHQKLKTAYFLYYEADKYGVMEGTRRMDGEIIIYPGRNSVKLHFANTSLTHLTIENASKKLFELFKSKEQENKRVQIADKKKQISDSGSTKLQMQAIEIACRKCKMDAHITVFERKKDATTYADRIAKRFWHKNMAVKKSFMGCQTMDMTFFFDETGKAVFTYAGYSDGRDSGTDLASAFKKADRLRLAMDEAMQKLLRERPDQPEKTHGFSIKQKYADRFLLGELTVEIQNQEQMDALVKLVKDTGKQLAKDSIKEYDAYYPYISYNPRLASIMAYSVAIFEDKTPPFSVIIDTDRSLVKSRRTKNNQEAKKG